MPARSRLLLVLIVAVAAAVGVVVSLWRPPAPPDLAWAPYQDDYHTKIDLARLEHELPLSPATLARVTPASLKALDQEQLNQLYARLTAGPIPDGPLGGDLFFPRGASGDVRLSEIVGGVKGLFLGVGSIKKLTFEGATTWLLFPAKLYCGQSLLDGRRESTIIDYAFTDDIEGYREKPAFSSPVGGRDRRPPRHGRRPRRHPRRSPPPRSGWWTPRTPGRVSRRWAGRSSTSWSAGRAARVRCPSPSPNSRACSRDASPAPRPARPSSSRSSRSTARSSGTPRAR